MTNPLTRWSRILCLLLTLVVFIVAPLSAFAHASNDTATDTVSAIAAPQAHPLLDDLKTEASPHGIRFHYPERFEAQVRPLLDEAPEIQQKILKDFAPNTLDGVNVYLLPSIERYFTERDIFPRSPHWASGLALLREDVILIRLKPIAGGRLELDRTLGHELSHIALHRHAGGARLPTWFIEGFAIFQTEEWTMTRAEALVEAGLAGNIRPLRELTRGFPSDGGEAQLAYAESAHFVFWLSQRYGREHVRTLLDHLHKGQTFDGAFASTFPGTFREVEASWRESIEIEGGWVWTLFNAGTAAVLLLIILAFLASRVRRRRREALARLAATEAPNPGIPVHLRDFGPFTQSMHRS